MCSNASLCPPPSAICLSEPLAYFAVKGRKHFQAAFADLSTWPMSFAHLPLISTESANKVKVVVPAQERGRVLTAECGNPGVIGRNWSAGSP